MADTILTRTALLTALADNGTKAITAQVVRNWLVSSFTTAPHAIKSSAGPYTLTIDDGTLIISYTGNYVINLPAANTANIVGLRFRIKKTSSAAYSVTITPNGADTIDGDANLVMVTQNNGIELVPDGVSRWNIF